MVSGKRTLKILSIAILSATVSAYASDWPQFKHDSARRGNVPAEKLTLPMQRIVAVKFPAPIYASPAVVADKVYVQDARGHVACVDGRSNKILWMTSIDGVTNTSSPAVTHGKVYIGSSAGYLAILDAATGKLIKKVPADGGVISAPAVTKTAVYFVSVNGHIYKTDFDGKIVWDYRFAKSCNLGVAVEGQQIAVLSNVCHILEDQGSSVREVRKIRAVCPTGGPVFFGDQKHVAFQSFDSEAGRLSVIKFKKERRRFVGTIGDFNDSRVTPSVRGGICYRGDVALSSDRKKPARWRTRCPDMQPGGFHSSPALSEKHCILGAESGRVYFFPLPAAVPATDKKKRRRSRRVEPAWTFETVGVSQDVNQAVSSSPAVSNGRVYFGGEDGILYGLGKGQEVAVTNLPGTKKRAAAKAKPQGSEWPTAAGDMGYSGVSTDTKIKPPFRIKWRTRIWSTFKSGVTVADGKVFGAARMGQLTTLDADTGEILWRTLHPYGESRPAPVYSAGKLLVMRGVEDQAWKPNASGGIWCHQADTGKLLWRKPLKLGYHFNADGLVADGKLCFVCWNGGGGAIEAAAYRLKDGSVVWQKRYEKLIPSEKPTPIRHASALGDGLLFFSVGHSETLGRKRHIKEEFAATIALNPQNGKLIWKNTKHRLIRGSRISFRKGILAVFSPDGCHALEAKTGKYLWTSIPPNKKKLHWGHYYMNALSDVFLDSKGQRGLLGYTGCSYPLYVNGLWYGHSGVATPDLVAWSEVPSKRRGNVGGYRRRVIWKHRFLSNACPSPAPAYGRLYYSPNGEGVVYCFEPTESTGRKRYK